MQDAERNKELYKIVLDEYRFQINLNWDRAKFFLNLSLVLIGTTATLIKLNQISVAIAVAFFLVGSVVALTGRTTLLKGHEYYREISKRKGQLEQRMGWKDEAIAATPGQQIAQTYFGTTENWLARKLRPESITAWLSRLFLLLALLNNLGIVQSVFWGYTGRVSWL